MKKYERRILVAVTGLSPQIVTETLYALYKQDFIPTEIHLITTVNGRNRAVRDLLDPITGQFFAFCNDYHLVGKIRFDESLIHVIHNPSGFELNDISTSEENESAADQISSLTRELCADDNAEMHVSIAGGRKTMGFFLGYALSLYGRQQDSLSHVLVSAPYENNKDFFYPSQKPRIIINHDGEELDASLAQIKLANIPFIRLRDEMPTDLLNGKRSYSETVHLAQIAIAPEIKLIFNKDNRTVICSGQSVKLTPLDFAFYLWMAKIKKIGEEGAIRPNQSGTSEGFLETYFEIVGDSADFDNTKDALTPKHQEDLFTTYFREKRTHINKALKNKLGEKLANLYQIESKGKRNHTEYELSLDAERIEILESQNK